MNMEYETLKSIVLHCFSITKSYIMSNNHKKCKK